jgi:hypothetical protein
MRAFYLGWSIRQTPSKQKAAMLGKGQAARPEGAVSVQENVEDPYLLEFLGLEDEYSETQLEEAIIRHLEAFLLELGTHEPTLLMPPLPGSVLQNPWRAGGGHHVARTAHRDQLLFDDRRVRLLLELLPALNPPRGEALADLRALLPGAEV